MDFPENIHAIGSRGIRFPLGGFILSANETVRKLINFSSIANKFKLRGGKEDV